MIDISSILYEITEDKHVYDKDFDLIESSLLDSFALIELLSTLEDNGILIQPTRIKQDDLRTVNNIEKLIKDTKDKK